MYLGLGIGFITATLVGAKFADKIYKTVGTFHFALSLLFSSLAHFSAG